MGAAKVSCIINRNLPSVRVLLYVLNVAASAEPFRLCVLLDLNTHTHTSDEELNLLFEVYNVRGEALVDIFGLEKEGDY